MSVPVTQVHELLELALSSLPASSSASAAPIAIPRDADLRWLLHRIADMVPEGAVRVSKRKIDQMTANETSDGDVPPHSVLERLPDELLLKVLSRLPTVERMRLRKVNRRFRDVLSLEQAWLDVDLSTLGQRITDASVEHLAKIVRKTQKLNLWGCHGISENGLTEVISHTEALESVVLARCNVSLELLHSLSLFNGARQLRSIVLWNCDKIDDDGITLLAALPHLEDLNVGYCSHISDAGFISLAKARKLITLNALWCFKITDQALTALAENCPLRDLNVGGCPSLTDASVVHLASRGLALESLTLSGCTLVTDTSILEIANHCLNLKSLNLSLCKNISSVSVSIITANCTRLRSLFLEGCHEVNDESFHFTGISELKDLSVGFCSQITPRGLLHILSHSPMLETLDVRWLYHMNPSVLHNIRDHNRKIKLLDARWCDGISLEDLHALAASLASSEFKFKHAKTHSADS